MKKLLNTVLLGCLLFFNITPLISQDKQPVYSLPIAYSPSPDLVIRFNVTFKDSPDKAEPFPDGTEISTYWENEAGELFYLNTHYVDNSQSDYNTTTHNDIYGKEDLKKLHFYLESDDFGRIPYVGNGSANAGRKDSVLFANGGTFANDLPVKNTRFYRGGLITMFESYEQPVRDGYIFNGWEKTNFAGGANLGAWDIETDLVPDDRIYLKATWKSSASVLTVKHVDTKGNPVGDDVILNGTIGDSYTTEALELDDFVLVTTPTNAKGVYTENVHEVTYIYKQRDVGIINVHYLDVNGNSIKDGLLLTGAFDETYHIEAPVIDGWILERTDGETSGSFTYQDKEVSFIYKKDVIVEDEDEVVTKPEVEDKEDETTKENSKTPNTNVKQYSTLYLNLILIALILVLNTSSRKKFSK